ncbi:UvrD-helicase domain-containing protein [Nocardioides sp. Kera G14]|uniref:UvrD-helicase domain-containing protein n=1 Tax=Nocardioides sp. Kera G14 TaxID=2884264 RepID=UPI001D118311|nr:UvrD-helicase domain-containing protein [Nocardioides sp. Kera G14]UDY24570.1 DEAD/DEAH box helicase [Nocardioides sp. Kera G14]
MTPVSIDSPEELARLMGVTHPASPEQWAAITAPLEPAVVIAGAGSGKTTLMAARVVYLVLTGQVRPDEILGLTFTTKATAELRARIMRALEAAGALDETEDGEVLEPTVATYNAYAASLLSDHGLRIGHEPDTRVVTDAARYQLGARAIDRHSGVVMLLSDHPPTVIQWLLALDSQLNEHLRTPAEVRAFDEEARVGFMRELEAEQAGKARSTYLGVYESAINTLERRGELLDLVETYRRLKRELGLMDFSDQIALAAQLATEHPEVGAGERDRFKVVLLDEYQDTSTAQAIMLSKLYGDGHAVMAVGDPNQAIYGWRGASVSNITGFGAVFPKASGEPADLFHLTVNRRSGARILEAANALAAPLLAVTPSVKPLVADPARGSGRVTTQVFERQVDELVWLAEEIATVHEAGTDWARLAVLTRDNASAGLAFDVLSNAGIPVEIVGLSGLLRLPEIAEIVAVLHLLQDVTANAAMLTLLNGPRWAVGLRDQRLLAKRAEELAGGRRDSDRGPIDEALASLADGVDPAELPALDDALSDPGDLDYSPEARERFGLLAGELRMLRSHLGEPLMDVVRRVVDTLGTDIELASATTPAAAARRDNLDLFLKAVADFQAIDGDISMSALLAYLTAEEEQGSGLELATPSEADSVKLLTVHRSKGLEWAEVFCMGVAETAFPSNRGRSTWISTPSVIPSPLRRDEFDIPHLVGFSKADIDEWKQRLKAHDANEELRLGYVAFTRAESRLSVTSYLWTARRTPFGPSSFQRLVRDLLTELWEEIVEWLEKPEKGAANPYDALDPEKPWPLPGPGEEARLRRAAAELVASIDPTAPDEELDMEQLAIVNEWDEELGRLLAEARAETATEVVVRRPDSLSATALSRWQEDPEGFARELARPMPRRPSAAARFGTRFHAWVETRFGQQDLFDLTDLPGQADAGIEDDADLAEVIKAFESGPFAERPPAFVEAPFALVLAGQVVRGRIDAIYAEPSTDGREGWLIIDWKTNRSATADPLQLAIYRLAWAELQGIAIDQVRAAFYYVRTGELVEAEDLPDRSDLEDLLGQQG